MPSAGRPLTGRVLAELAGRGVLVAPITLHTGVASAEVDEPPYPEWFEIPPATADLIRHVHAAGGRVIAVGTTGVTGTIAAGQTHGGSPAQLVHGFHYAFVGAACFVAVSLIAMLAMLRKEHVAKIEAAAADGDAVAVGI